MSAVFAAALLAKTVLVLLLLLSCVLGQEDGVCFDNEREFGSWMCALKESLDAGKAGKEESSFKTLFLGEGGETWRFGRVREEECWNIGVLSYSLSFLSVLSSCFWSLDLKMSQKERRVRHCRVYD